MSEADNKKRYILFSKDDGRPDSEKPCAFFASAAGCKNGSKCRFLHEKSFNKTSSHQENSVKNKVPHTNQDRMLPNENKSVSVNILSRETKVVTTPSLSNDAIIQQLQQQLLEQQRLIDAQGQANLNRNNDKNKHEKKRKSIDTKPKEDSPKNSKIQKQFITQEVPSVVIHPYSLVQSQFTNNVSYTSNVASTSLPKQPNQMFKLNHVEVNEYDDDDDNDDDDDDEEKNVFLESVVNHVLDTDKKQAPHKQKFQAAASQIVPSQLQHQFDSINQQVQKPLETLITTSPFVSADDAIKALQSSGSAHAIHGSAKKSIFAISKGNNKTSSNNTVVPKTVKIPFNPSAVGLKSLNWQQLVEVTKLNPRYLANYSFTEDSTWVRAKSYGSWCVEQSVPDLISLDCEMCETTDPVNGIKCDNALIRLSILDLSGKVLVDSLITPGLPITDARTHIHGITEKQLFSATWTLRHAQAALLNICSDKTIIVGHSIHKDLKALRFSHSRVIDTAYLYTIENEPGAAPSLRDISEQTLGIKLPETHDSVQDAQAALHAAGILLVEGPQAAIVRSSGTGSVIKDASMLVHRIPDYCSDKHLEEMILGYTYIMPFKINPIIRGGELLTKGDIPSGKTIITFSSTQHRDLAFDSIAGPNRPDKQNRPQKRVYMRGGGYICIRK